MNDDIVTRLRHIYSQKDVGVSLDAEIFVQAADEIERLRAEVEFWHTTARRAMDNTDKALTIIELQKALQSEIDKAAKSD